MYCMFLGILLIGTRNYLTHLLLFPCHSCQAVQSPFNWYISIVKLTCYASGERNGERRGVGRWKWGASERIHTPFFFRNRLVSSGVYYHLSNLILHCFHRPGWELIAPGATGEEESSYVYLLPDCILLVCCWKVSVQRKGKWFVSHMPCMSSQWLREKSTQRCRKSVLLLTYTGELLVELKKIIFWDAAEA